jgi:hypothetical protein
MWKLLAIDPGYKSGYAFWEVEPEEGTALLMESGVVRGSTKKILALVDLCGSDPPNGLDTIVVEGQYFQRHRRNFRGRKIQLSPSTTAATMATRIRWETVAEMRGWRVDDPVRPSAWQATVLGLSSRAGRERIKAASLEYVTRWAGRPARQDEADAVCLGVHWLLTHRLQPIARTS